MTGCKLSTCDCVLHFTFTDGVYEKVEAVSRCEAHGKLSPEEIHADHVLQNSAEWPLESRQTLYDGLKAGGPSAVRVAALYKIGSPDVSE